MKDRDDYVNPVLKKPIKETTEDMLKTKGAERVPDHAAFINDGDSLAKQVADLTKGLKGLMFENKTAVKEFGKV